MITNLENKTTLFYTLDIWDCANLSKTSEEYHKSYIALCTRQYITPCPPLPKSSPMWGLPGNIASAILVMVNYSSFAKII